jgi:small GTP-binding protein
MKKKSGKNEVITYFRIITLGDCFVGKTSIIRTLANDNTNFETLSTVGINYNIKEFTMDDNRKIGLKVIDTCGQEKFRSLSKSYFKNVDAVLFVFSLNDKESFDNIKQWIELYDINSNSLITLKY